MAVYGNKVGNITDILAESIRQDEIFFSNFLAEDSYQLEGVLLEKFDLKGIVDKIKGYWEKFKNWVGESFKKAIKFIREKTAKIRTDISNNKIIQYALKDLQYGEKDDTKKKYLYQVINPEIIVQYSQFVENIVNEMKIDDGKKIGEKLQTAISKDGMALEQLKTSLICSDIDFEGKNRFGWVKEQAEKINGRLNKLVEACEKSISVVNSTISKIDKQVKDGEAAINRVEDPKKASLAREILMAISDLTSPMKTAVSIITVVSQLGVTTVSYNVNSINLAATKAGIEVEDDKKENEKKDDNKGDEDQK